MFIIKIFFRFYLLIKLYNQQKAMLSFIKEFYEFLKVRKILVTTNNSFSIIWCFDSFKSRVCCSAIHLYNFLSVINFRYISILS